MKKNIISILFCIMLLVPSCASSKPSSNPIEHPIETVDKFGEGKSKGLMELLIAGLILYSLNLMITR